MCFNKMSKKISLSNTYSLNILNNYNINALFERKKERKKKKKERKKELKKERKKERKKQIINSFDKIVSMSNNL